MHSDSPLPGLYMIDDNELAANAMQRCVARGGKFRWLGSATDGAAAVSAVLEQRPSVVLLDVEMPGVDTFSILRRITTQCPGTAVVMFSGHTQAELITRALEEGAAGYIAKDEPIEVITTELTRAAQGEVVLSPAALESFAMRRA